MKTIALPLVIAALSLTACAMSPAAKPAPMPAPAPPKPTLSDLSWMTGDWIQAGPKGEDRESWLPARGGAMAGVNQVYRPRQPVRMEMMTITTSSTGLVFVAMPAGAEPTVFSLVNDGRDKAVFENLDHDFPQRVIYQRCESDLCARIEGMVDGAMQSVDWRFSRADAPSMPPPPPPVTP
jgi:hypothetical protein